LARNVPVPQRESLLVHQPRIADNSDFDVMFGGSGVAPLVGAWKREMPIMDRRPHFPEWD
jgi:hypothetical protein